MTIEQYQEQSKRTCATLGSLQLDLAHMVLGMNTEINELEDALSGRDFVNVSEEILDVIFYVANYCTFRNYPLSEIIFDIGSTPVTTENLYRQVSLLQDLVKKFMAYGKEIDPQKEVSILVEICYICVILLRKYDLDLNKSMQNNIDKLRIRFPEKFTTENAINRDLDSERKELEK